MLGPQEYVYIEAEKEAHVRDAIRGLRTLFIGKGVRLVPLAEMVHAVTVNRTAKATIGAWAVACIAHGLRLGICSRSCFGEVWLAAVHKQRE